MTKIHSYQVFGKIPHFPTRIYLWRLWDHWSNFFSAVGDAWWELKLDRAHYLKRNGCKCGVTVDDRDWHDHRDRARDEMWGKRFK